MATETYVLIALTAFILVHAAPSGNVTNSNETTKNASQVAETLTNVDEAPKEPEQGARQKRYYYSFGTRVNPVPYQPGISEFDQPDLAFSQIYRKLKDISALVRTPDIAPPPQLPPQLPFYIPVLFVPHLGGCRCRPRGNSTSPGLENRFPEMDDTRQNWGIINPDPEEDTTDYNRPISFKPVPPPPDSRPPPPVDHGSSQADANVPSQRPPAASPPQAPGPAPPQTTIAPTACDAAVLSCCHQSPVSYSCFAAQGCPDISQLAFNGNPCNADNILKVVVKYQRFYAQRTG